MQPLLQDGLIVAAKFLATLPLFYFLLVDAANTLSGQSDAFRKTDTHEWADEGNPLWWMWGMNRYTFALGITLFGYLYAVIAFLVPADWVAWAYTIVLIVLGTLTHWVAGQSWSQSRCALVVGSPPMNWFIDAQMVVLLALAIPTAIAWATLFGCARSGVDAARMSAITRWTSVGLCGAFVLVQAVALPVFAIRSRRSPTVVYTTSTPP